MTGPAEAQRAPQTVGNVIDQMTADYILELASRAESLWRSVGEGAWRGDVRIMQYHCREIRLVTLATFEAVKEFGGGPDEGLKQ